MSQSSKTMTERDASQVQRFAFNDVDKSLTVNGFLVGKVGHKIEVTITTTSVTDDSEVYSFSDSGTLLYSLKIVYTDGSRSQMVSAERIS